MGMSGGGGAVTVQRGGRKRRRRRMVADINITPLVDVMLVLLVIFIVTAPSMTKEEGLAVDVPHAKGTAGGGTNAVSYVVSIDSTGKVSANGVIVEPANIDAEIPKLLKGAENQIVTVRADTNARHGSVIKVLSAIRAAGIVKINFAVSGEK